MTDSLGIPDSLGIRTTPLDDSLLPLPLFDSPSAGQRDLRELDALINRRSSVQDEFDGDSEAEFVQRRKHVGTVVLTALWLGIICFILTYIYGHRAFKDWLKVCQDATEHHKDIKGGWDFYRTGFAPLDALTCFQTKLFHLAQMSRQGRLALNLFMNLWASFIAWAGIHSCKSHVGYGGAIFLSVCLALAQAYGAGVISFIWCSIYIWTLGSGVGLHDRQVWMSASMSLIAWTACAAFLVVGKHGAIDKAVFWYLVLPPILPLIWSMTVYIPTTTHTFQMLGARAARIVHLLYAGMSLGWHLHTLAQFVRHPAHDATGHEAVVVNLLWIQLIFLWAGLLLCVFYETGLVEAAKSLSVSFLFGPGTALQRWRWLQETNNQHGLEKVLGQSATGIV